MTLNNSNVTISIKDLDKSIVFYQSIGFELKQRWGNHFAQLTGQGISIGLHPSERSFSGSGNVSLGFTVDNFDEAQLTLQTLSIKATVRNEEGGQFLHFTDPDGTLLYFIKPKW